MQDKKSEIRVFNKHYDSNYISFDKYAHSYDSIFQLANLKPQESLFLDIACGNETLRIHELNKRGFHVVGVDISRKAIEKLTQNDIVNSNSFFVADAEEMPFKGETFDCIFIWCFLHHLPFMEKIFLEISRVLKKDGRLFFLEPNGSNPIQIVSLFTSRMLTNRFMLNKINHIATPNETYHKITKYKIMLMKYGFIITQMYSLYVPNRQINLNMYASDSEMKFGNNILLYLNKIREILFGISWKILPQPFCGDAVIILAVKSENNK